MVHVKFADHALENIDQIAAYIAKDAPAFSEIFVESVFDKVELLQSNPRLGRKILEFDREGLRELIYGRYRIAYKILDKSPIDIIAIHHSSQRMSEESLFE